MDIAKKVEKIRLATVRMYQSADAAVERDAPAEDVEKLYQRAQTAYRKLAAARIEARAMGVET